MTEPRPNPGTVRRRLRTRSPRPHNVYSKSRPLILSDRELCLVTVIGVLAGALAAVEAGDDIDHDRTWRQVIGGLQDVGVLA